MSVLAQCGYGRANKIELGLDAGLIQGIIMSPRDERPQRLESAVQQIANDYPDAVILFDPQFYASTLNGARDGFLNEYDYYRNNYGLNRTDFSGSRIVGYVRGCLDYQHLTYGDNLTYLVSPSILFDDFRDYWSQVALNMAAESVDYHPELEDPQPLLVSIIVSETAFNSLDAVEQFLDALTQLDVDGFYIIIRRNANTLQNAMESALFGRLLFFCYVLGEINEYRVVVGYSDWHSFLLESVGVNFTGSGWYHNLRQFSIARFQPTTGGRRPHKRYSSVKLLSSPLITPELQDVHLAGLLPNVLSGSQYDYILGSNPTAGEANWSDEIACLAHWFSLNSLLNRIASQLTVQDRIQESLQNLQAARTLFQRLETQGISFDPSTGPNHIDEWRTAVREFRGVAGI